MTKIFGIFLRYLAAAFIAFGTSYLAAFVGLAFYGNPDAGNELLSVTRFIGFAAILAGGFCFPVSSRWFRSAILLGCGLMLYCAMEYARGNDPYFPALVPYPHFMPLLRGGMLAIALHGVIAVFLMKWRSRSTAPTIKPAINCPAS